MIRHAADLALTPPPRRLLWWGAVAVLVLASAAAALIVLAVQTRRAELETGLRARLDALAAGRAEVIATWLDGAARLGRRVTENNAVRLFLAEAEAVGAAEPTLAAQLPYMREALAEFARQHELLAAHLLDGTGRPLASSAGAPPPMPYGDRRFSALRAGPAGLELDVLLPVAAPQEARTVGALAMTLAVGERLAALTAPGPLARPGEKMRLFQAGGSGTVEIVPGGTPSLRAPAAPAPAAVAPLAFAERAGAYTVGVVVPEAALLVVQAAPAAAVGRPVAAFTRTATAVAVLAVVAIGLAFATLWWRQRGAHYRALAAHIEAARQAREQALQSTITALGRTVETADPWLAGHGLRVREAALAAGRRLGLAEDDLATLEMAADVAQVGKLAVPRDILAKAERLTPEEEAVMHTHVRHAARILGDIDFGLPVRQTVLAMYERLDGSGYPARLAGDAVPPLARILAVADVYAARTAPRSYRAAIAAADAIGVLRRASPGRYDEAAVAALAAAVAEGEL